MGSEFKFLKSNQLTLVDVAKNSVKLWYLPAVKLVLTLKQSALNLR